MRNKRTMVLAGVLAGLALIAGAWYFFSSRVIRVWVYTDYTFRINHTNWPTLLTGRFQEVNRIYQRTGTGVFWKVLDTSEADPTGSIPSVDARRTNMALHFNHDTDIYVIFTGVQQGGRTGSVNPFTRVAVVVDYPGKSEAINSRLLAHELAYLFGAPHDPGWTESLMSERPESSKFSGRTVAIIRKMRNYPFNLGIDGLTDPTWEKRAMEAVEQDDIATHANALAHAHNTLGVALIDERRNGPALAHFRAATKADPNDKSLHLNLAEALTRDGQYDAALVEAREAVRLDPGDPLSHRALGALLGRNHQPEASLQELQTAIRLQPNDPQNKVLLGLEYAGMFGHMDEAVATLQQAALADPNSVTARTSLEKTEALKVRLETALERERAVVHDHPDDPDAHARLAAAEARSGDLKGAIRDYQKVAELRPDSGSPHLQLAEVYLAQGDSNTAWEEVRKARALGADPSPTLMARLPAQK